MAEATYSQVEAVVKRCFADNGRSGRVESEPHVLAETSGAGCSSQNNAERHSSTARTVTPHEIGHKIRPPLRTWCFQSVLIDTYVHQIQGFNNRPDPIRQNEIHRLVVSPLELTYRITGRLGEGGRDEDDVLEL